MSVRTHLRETFAYPSSNADSDSDRELDEEHQERLIARLAADDARKTAGYRNAFVGIPLLAAGYFLGTLLFFGSSSSNSSSGGVKRTRATGRQSGVAVIAVSSLLCTAYILRFQPLTGSGEGKKGGLRGDTRGPLERFLLPLNGVLVAVMMVAAGVSWNKGAGEEAVREMLPGVVFGLCMFVRWQLAPLDLGELERARYELKGA